MNAIIRIYWNPADRADSYDLSLPGNDQNVQGTEVTVQLPENGNYTAIVTPRNSAGIGPSASLDIQVPPHDGGTHPPGSVTGLGYEFQGWTS